VEEMDYNMCSAGFVGLNLDDPGVDATVFTKNRNRLLEAEVAKEFLGRVVGQAREKEWTSDEHFTVDGTLLEAWASVKSFQPKDKKSSPPGGSGNPTVNFHGEKRSNQTHESKTDPDALLARKGRGKEAKLSYSGNLLVENRNRIDRFESGMGSDGHGRTRCGDDHVAGWFQERACDGGRRQGIRYGGVCTRVPEHARDAARGAKLARRGGSAIDGRTAQQAGYRISQKKRKRVEEYFGWLKTICSLPQSAGIADVEGGLDVHLRVRRL